MCSNVNVHSDREHTAEPIDSNKIKAFFGTHMGRGSLQRQLQASMAESPQRMRAVQI